MSHGQQPFTHEVEYEKHTHTTWDYMQRIAKLVNLRNNEWTFFHNPGNADGGRIPEGTVVPPQTVGPALIKQWNTRLFNASGANSAGITLSSNQLVFTITGSFDVDISCRFMQTGFTGIRLRNITAGTTELYTAGKFVDPGISNDAYINLKGKIRVNGTSGSPVTLEIQYNCDNSPGHIGPPLLLFPVPQVNGNTTALGPNILTNNGITSSDNICATCIIKQTA